MIGHTISHYLITEKIGEGGMGVVCKARDTHLDRFVAIKVLPAGKVADPGRKARFVREAKSASALNHPNIVHIYDIGQQDGIDFMAMEFVAGKTLRQKEAPRAVHEIIADVLGEVERIIRHCLRKDPTRRRFRHQSGRVSLG